MNRALIWCALLVARRHLSDRLGLVVSARASLAGLERSASLASASTRTAHDAKRRLASDEVSNLYEFYTCATMSTTNLRIHAQKN